MIWHVMPVNDLKEHVDKSTCECEPKIIAVESGDLICVHNSFDGREAMEWVDEILNGKVDAKEP